MSQHFIHYVPRRIVSRFPDDANHPWFADVQALDAGFFRPTFHISRRKTGPTQQVREGDTIWILGQIVSPWGVLPPGIDARIEVERVERGRDGALRFIASKQSQWFPLSDISHTLPFLKSLAGQGRLNELLKDPTAPIGRSLQSMRLLASAEPLEEHLGKLSLQPVHFISYRICDGTHAAFVKTKALLAQQQVVFWDRWSLPRRLAERRELVDCEALDCHLMEQLASAGTVWGIESPAYSAEGSYSQKEKIKALQLGTYHAVAGC
ncbi:hypothetical protein [Pseudomonas sp. B21-053]|uniref:hypothetical protein n=1 Tax=Pseudomonas sp. B21-053 TaxID=2895493 RepID=UPI0022321C60|nr:hypothetical protein [Pseudomonas sp. B21-053]UZE14738.1 hypothetical protein LOY68_14390 [Pseudomonas sp. B21-053]